MGVCVCRFVCAIDKKTVFTGHIDTVGTILVSTVNVVYLMVCLRLQYSCVSELSCVHARVHSRAE